MECMHHIVAICHFTGCDEESIISPGILYWYTLCTSSINRDKWMIFRICVQLVDIRGYGTVSSVPNFDFKM